MLPKLALKHHSKCNKYIGGGEEQGAKSDCNGNGVFAGDFVRQRSVLLIRFLELDFFSFSRQISKRKEEKDPPDPLI
jgi:hypothetical protein